MYSISLLVKLLLALFFSSSLKIANSSLGFDSEISFLSMVNNITAKEYISISLLGFSSVRALGDLK